jgi:alanine dehydrogenase
MLIGVPREIKVREYRVGLTPTSVRELTAHGHEILVETSAGAGIGMEDATTNVRAPGSSLRLRRFSAGPI